MNCIHCQSEAILKNGTKTLKTAQVLQQYLCNTCGRRFNGTVLSLHWRAEEFSEMVKFLSCT
jgi:transposase-like protein